LPALHNGAGNGGAPAAQLNPESALLGLTGALTAVPESDFEPIA
jgi:hypothetical protein